MGISYEFLVVIAEPNKGDDGDNSVVLLFRKYPGSVDLWVLGADKWRHLQLHSYKSRPKTTGMSTLANVRLYRSKDRAYTNLEIHTPVWKISTCVHHFEPSYTFGRMCNRTGETLQRNMTHWDGTPDVWRGRYESGAMRRGTMPSSASAVVATTSFPASH